MSERKQRINVMFTQETLNELEKQVPEYQRSEYIEAAVRERLGLPPMTQQATKKGFAVYTRSIDDGFGIQTVYVNDGKIVSQFLGPREGLYGSYTGDGNPEWMGQDVSVLRGNGFTKMRGSRVQDIELDWLQSDL